MDQGLRDFQVEGMSQAATTWDHEVVVTTSADTATPETTVALRGVQSDVEVNPEDLQQFGYQIKRVFSLTVPDSDLVRTIKDGMRAVESNTGELARILWHKRDILGSTFFFGSVNK